MKTCNILNSILQVFILQKNWRYFMSKKNFIKILFTLLIVVFTFSVIKISQKDSVETSGQIENLDNKKIGWGIKRNDNHNQPDLGSVNKQIIDEENGIAMGNKDSKKVYLTFDEGYEAGYTEKILEVLKQNNVKATFFVVGKEDEESQEMYKRIVNEGHTLGMHSYSHKYSVIYDSLENFEDDLTKIQNYLYDITGEDCHYYRFPGGSSNQVSNTDMKEFIKYLNDQDVTYFDWNVTSGDATSQAYTADELVDNVLEDVVKYKTSVVLLHDANTKETTVEALGPMIEALQAQGVELLPITEDTTVIQHISADSVEYKKWRFLIMSFFEM